METLIIYEISFNHLAAELALVQSEEGLAPDTLVNNNTGSWRVAHAASPTAKVTPDP